MAFNETNFFEGAEKLIEIWFGNHYSENNEDIENEDIQNLSSIIRSSEDEDDEKISNDSSDFDTFTEMKLSIKDDNKNDKANRADLRRIPRKALDQMLQFVKCEIITKEATVKSGIDKIFSDALVDDYLFDPCGYSMNGILKGVS
ncbi:hypothetical protein RND71_043279 [Anisodus tanguticus]|uniref:Uncharacterized protein n=1 Tax=Anisodus tanguticus TaxID=243964 RepID=A0AAE1QPB8_9SOLA|nr:hypothetical protein RND71_043279 [Anisodus tanguticus]